jgi:hypothetical protein
MTTDTSTDAPMSDAPETILVGLSNGSLLIDSKGQALSGIENHVQYRRADLPPTDEQLMADPRVTVLVEALVEMFVQYGPSDKARQALAAFPAQGVET